MDDATVARGSRDLLILDSLSAIFEELAAMEDTAQVRSLRAQARSYESAVKAWATVRPSEAQISAMFELVSGLHGKVVAAAARASQRGGPSR
ncbi:MAG TPA: hypothetical protein VGI39_04025 [Polyangiaceae bacterium]